MGVDGVTTVRYIVDDVEDAVAFYVSKLVYRFIATASARRLSLWAPKPITDT